MSEDCEDKLWRFEGATAVSISIVVLCLISQCISLFQYKIAPKLAHKSPYCNVHLMAEYSNVDRIKFDQLFINTVTRFQLTIYGLIYIVPYISFTNGLANIDCDGIGAYIIFLVEIQGVLLWELVLETQQPRFDIPVMLHHIFAMVGMCYAFYLVEIYGMKGAFERVPYGSVVLFFVMFFGQLHFGMFGSLFVYDFALTTKWKYYIWYIKTVWNAVVSYIFFGIIFDLYCIIYFSKMDVIFQIFSVLSIFVFNFVEGYYATLSFKILKAKRLQYTQSLNKAIKNIQLGLDDDQTGARVGHKEQPPMHKSVSPSVYL